MTSELIAFTEYEEEICFDLDDPDFSPSTKSGTVGGNSSNLRTNALTCSMEARGSRGKGGNQGPPAGAILRCRRQSFRVLGQDPAHQTSWGEPLHVPIPSEDGSLNPEKKRLDLKPLADVRVPTSIQSQNPGHHSEIPHFGRPYPGSDPFGQHPHLMSIVPSPMSLAGVHPLEMHGAHSNELIYRSHSYGALSALSRGSYGSLSSLEDVHQFLSQSEQAVLSIEELRLQLNSCFTCGVSWQEEHVSLDCSECGGYSLERPCPICEGQCDSVWKRDLTMTHASGKARWEGKCGLERSLSQSRIIFESLSMSPENEAQLCQRLENLKS